MSISWSKECYQSSNQLTLFHQCFLFVNDASVCSYLSINIINLSTTGADSDPPPPPTTTLPNTFHVNIRHGLLLPARGVESQILWLHHSFIIFVFTFSTFNHNHTCCHQPYFSSRDHPRRTNQVSIRHTPRSDTLLRFKLISFAWSVPFILPNTSCLLPAVYPVMWGNWVLWMNFISTYNLLLYINWHVENGRWLISSIQLQLSQFLSVWLWISLPPPHPLPPLSFSISLFLSLSFSLCVSLSVSLTISHILPLSLSLSYSLYLTIFHIISLSLSLSLHFSSLLINVNLFSSIIPVLRKES